MKAFAGVLAVLGWLLAVAIGPASAANCVPTTTPNTKGVTANSALEVAEDACNYLKNGVTATQFTPSASGARGTPFTVNLTDSSGTLPTNGGTVIVANAGTTNPMFCNVNGVAATTSDQPILAGSWFSFGIPATQTTLHCIATGGTTTANMLGGTGSGAGAGGGGGGGGSVTQGTSPWVDNVSQFGGNNVVTGTGVGGNGIPRVTVSSDSSFTPAAAASGVAIGNVGALTNVVCVTPATTSATYAANVVVGGLLTFTNMFTAKHSGTIQSIAVNFPTVQTVGFLFFPFASSPTTSAFTDHSAAAINVADVFTVRNPTPLSNPSSNLGTHTNYGAVGIGQAFVSADANLYGVLVPTATTASLAGTSNAVQVCVKVLQDN